MGEELVSDFLGDELGDFEELLSLTVIHVHSFSHSFLFLDGFVAWELLFGSAGEKGRWLEVVWCSAWQFSDG